jgi:antitoxin component of RelBE/YafQ-DinJ toxin-antitoxin module
MGKTTIVSSRIDEEIAAGFEKICDNLKVKKSAVMQELLKDFIVRNYAKESHESVEMIAPKIKDLDDE